MKAKATTTFLTRTQDTIFLRTTQYTIFLRTQYTIFLTTVHHFPEEKKKKELHHLPDNTIHHFPNKTTVHHFPDNTVHHFPQNTIFLTTQYTIFLTTQHHFPDSTVFPYPYTVHPFPGHYTGVVRSRGRGEGGGLMVSVLGADCKHSCLTVAGNGQHGAQVCHLQLVQSYPTISGHADSGGELLYLWGSLILVIWGWWGGGGRENMQHDIVTISRVLERGRWGSKSQPWEVLNLSSTFFFTTSF